MSREDPHKYSKTCVFVSLWFMAPTNTHGGLNQTDTTWGGPFYCSHSNTQPISTTEQGCYGDLKHKDAWGFWVGGDVPLISAIERKIQQWNTGGEKEREWWARKRDIEKVTDRKRDCIKFRQAFKVVQLLFLMFLFSAMVIPSQAIVNDSVLYIYN